MKSRPQQLDQRIEALLADPANTANPLLEPLQELWLLHREHLSRLDRITHLSDSYQSIARDRELSLNDRFDKQLRQLQKIARISDRYQEMLRDINDALKEASTHDALTGLANRRLIMDRLREEADRASRFGHAFVVAMVDVDYFKRINDTLGHDVGDRVLVAIGQTMQAGLREYDLCGRWGGEEFLLLLPQTVLDDALGVVERIHQSIRELRFDEDGAALTITASIGVAGHHAGDSYVQTLKRADDALLEAKRRGKDCFLSG
jgi:diguanylate cyclase (GGDEF)-like protein